MSPCQVLLHGCGTVGIEFINDFQIVADRVFGKFDSQLTSQCGTLSRKADERITYFPRLLNFTHRHVIVSAGDSHCRDERPFDECIPIDIRRYFSLNATFLKVFLNGFHNARSHLCPFVGAIHQTEDFPHLSDLSRAGNKAYDVDATIEHRYTRNETLNAWSCPVNIQDGDDNCLLMRCPFDEFGNRIDGISFHADEDHIRFSFELFGRRSLNLKRMFTLQIRFQFQTIGLY